MSNEVLRDCHHDIVLNMSACAAGRILYYLGFALKFAKVFEDDDIYHEILAFSNHVHKMISIHDEKFCKVVSVCKPVR